MLAKITVTWFESQQRPSVIRYCVVTWQVSVPVALQIFIWNVHSSNVSWDTGYVEWDSGT
jgi:hypothetical protein